MTSTKLPNLPESQFPHISNGMNVIIVSTSYVVVRLNESLYVDHLEEYLAHSSYSGNTSRHSLVALVSCDCTRSLQRSCRSSASVSLGGYQQGSAPTRGSRGESTPCLCQFLVAACTPWIVVTSQQSLPPLLQHCLLSVSVTSLLKDFL